MSSSSIASELQQFGTIDVYVFDGRDDFLSRLHEITGGRKIKGIEKTFAKLPRSPFTVTPEQISEKFSACQIFVPANVAPESGNEVFAQLMRGWFGQKLSYATSANMTYRWMMVHEVRHCQPDHFGGTAIKGHAEEYASDLFAFEHMAVPSNRDALAKDIIAFRMITSSLFADKTSMIGLSVKHGLGKRAQNDPVSAKQEIAAFQAVYEMIASHAKAIAAKATPTNLELIRAITELRERSVAGTIKTDNPLISEILIDLDDAVAHFAPKLHASVATRRSN
jgi:hypothetical protein